MSAWQHVYACIGNMFSATLIVAWHGSCGSLFSFFACNYCAIRKFAACCIL